MAKPETTAGSGLQAVLKGATDAINAGRGRTEAPAPSKVEPTLDEDDYDTGPLTRSYVEGESGDGEDAPVFKAGDHVTVTHDHQNNVLDVRHSEPDGTIPAKVDAGALEQAVLDVARLGLPHEFTDRLTEELREATERIKAEVAQLDADIEHLNARRTNAMLAYSGISAALTAMNK